MSRLHRPSLFSFPERKQTEPRAALPAEMEGFRQQGLTARVCRPFYCARNESGDLLVSSKRRSFVRAARRPAGPYRGGFIPAAAAASGYREVAPFARRSFQTATRAFTHARTDTRTTLVERRGLAWPSEKQQGRRRGVAPLNGSSHAARSSPRSRDRRRLRDSRVGGAAFINCPPPPARYLGARSRPLFFWFSLSSQSVVALWPVAGPRATSGPQLFSRPRDTTHNPPLFSCAAGFPGSSFASPAKLGLFAFGGGCLGCC